jgi:hypothetical protein
VVLSWSIGTHISQQPGVISFECQQRPLKEIGLIYTTTINENMDVAFM